MIATVGLLALLCVPIALWAVVHRKPRSRTRPETRPEGPRHRWWQP
jgi:hypothetical protein